MRTLSESEVAEFRVRVLAWGAEHFVDYPWRRGDLPLWQCLLVEAMLLRTRAEQVVPVFSEFLRRYPDVHALGEASPEEVRRLLAPLGLTWRNERIVALRDEVVAREGELPLDHAALRQLPGVGEYVASAVLMLHAELPAVLIDSNVVRLVARYVGESYGPETRRKRWLRDVVERLTPEEGVSAFGYAILDLAMKVCRPRSPRCLDCPLAGTCTAASVRPEHTQPRS